MKKLLQEFKEFALTSKVLDLAIAVIMGNAASKMVSSLVESILTPLIGIIMGGQSFSDLSIQVGDAAIMYGSFIQAVIDFLIVAVCVFMMMKGINGLNKLQHKEEKAKEKKETTEELLSDIREILKEVTLEK